MKFLMITFVLIAITLLPKVSYTAPSYDCSKANSKDEVLICKDKELGDLDVKMTDSYSKLISVLHEDEAKEIKKLQRNWLKTRKIIAFDPRKTVQKDEFVRILKIRGFYSRRIRGLNAAYEIKQAEKKYKSGDICEYMDTQLKKGKYTAIILNSIYEEYIGEYSEKYSKYTDIHLTDDDINNLSIDKNIIPYVEWQKRKLSGTLTKIDLNNDGIPEYRYHYTQGSMSCEDNIIAGLVKGKYKVIKPKYNPFYGEAGMCGETATYVKFNGEMFSLISGRGRIKVYKYDKNYKIDKICDLKK